MVQIMLDQPRSTTQEPERGTRVSRGRSRHWKMRLALGGLVLLVGLLAMLPQIMSSTLMRQRFADSILQDFDGKVEIGGADLAWWRPAELSNMTMTDRQGVTMAKIESAQVTAPLWRMLWPGKQTFELKLNRPEVVYEIDAYGRTNWEKVMTGLKPSKQGSFSWPEFRHGTQPLHIHVVDGSVVLKDHVSQRTIQAWGISAELKKSADFLEGVLKGQTQLITENQHQIPAGSIDARFQLAMAGDLVVAGDVQGTLQKTPLELIQPWLKQMVPHLHLAAGNADGEFQSKWTGNLRTGLKLAVSGTLSASDISVRSSEWAAGYQLTGAALTGEFSIDNTLPTIPGRFDIDWKLTNSRISPLPPAELPETLIDTPLPPALDKPLALGELALLTRGTLDPLKQMLHVEQFAIDSDVFKSQLSGEVRDLASGRPDFDLEGTSQGDLLPFLFLARPDLRENLSGKRLTAQEFALKGRLQVANQSTQATPEGAQPELGKPAEVEEAPAPDTLPLPPLVAEEGEAPSVTTPSTDPEPFAAVANWNWAELEAYGVPSKSGSLWTHYEDKLLRIVPVDVRIGTSGEFLAKAEVDFSNEQRRLRVQEGVVLKNVEFTENMCRSWLMYVAPVFAEATDLEGKFSLYLKQTEIDLQLGLAEQLEGVLQIQKSRLGPGPLIQQITAPLSGLANSTARPGRNLLGEGATWIELPPQEVAFKKQEGRIYHSRLVYQTGRVSIVSTGSVGDDQTLDLSLAIPLDFIAQGRPLGQLFQKPIQFKVEGTLSKPEIDASQLANFGKQLGLDAVDGLLQGIFERRRQK